MLSQHQPQVDHRAAIANRCLQGCALAGARGWELVQHDWGARQGAEDPPEPPSAGIAGRLARLVGITRAAARCLRTMLRVSVALHAAARRHTLSHVLPGQP